MTWAAVNRGTHGSSGVLKYHLTSRTNRSKIPPAQPPYLCAFQAFFPVSGFSNRATQRATVDFPDPELPTNAKVSPAAMSNAMS